MKVVSLIVLQASRSFQGNVAHMVPPFRLVESFGFLWIREGVWAELNDEWHKYYASILSVGKTGQKTLAGCMYQLQP